MHFINQRCWIPAFAGMTVESVKVLTYKGIIYG
jgi:hypothetical protein